MKLSPSAGLHGTITVPGDKSISHRAVMLGALAKVTQLVRKDVLFDEIAAVFGEKNRTAAQMAYDSVVITRK